MTMKKTSLCVMVALLALAVAGPAAAFQSPQKPGQWRITVEVDIPGMPVKMPPHTFNVCVTEDDLKDPQRSVPKDPKSQCTMSDFKIDGNTVSWTVDCPKQNTKGEGKITFSEESYTGWMKMQMGEQEMTSKYSGKWVGECKK
jgi:Protein of unknown function (DUF3617)